MNAVVAQMAAPTEHYRQIIADFEAHAVAAVKRIEANSPAGLDEAIIDVIANMHAGTWSAGVHAVRGKIYVSDGSSFLCVENTGERPSLTDPQHWRLIAKAGRDGRDAR